MDKCPRCGSTRVYPSRHRGIGERLRQLFTEKRPYRCHNCGWREWAEVAVRIPPQRDIDPRQLRRPHPERPLNGDDLDRLDPPAAPPKPSHHPGPLRGDEIDDIDPEQ
jgi:DNA-directed RNA polymerase subunit RPC12/RpoP